MSSIKRRLAAAVAKKTALSQQQARDAVRHTLSEIVDVLIEQRRVELRDFGVFELRVRSPRPVRDPRTGEQRWLPARLGVAFKPSRHLERRVAGLDPPGEASQR